MGEAWWLVLAVAVAVGWFVASRRGSWRLGARSRAHERLDAAAVEAPTLERRARSVLSPPRRIVAVSIGALGAAAAWMVVRHVGVALALGVVIGTIAWTAQDTIASTRVLRLEQQLADLIDLVVGTLRAGIGVVEGLESAARESKAPLRDLIEESSARIRLGDDPQHVFVDLRRRVPAESFRLFAFALAVHWQAGGSLAPTLASVGRAVRDRIDLSWRARAQAAEAQFSVVGILLLIYVLGYLMWRLEPQRLEQFLAWEPGAALITAIAVLQAIGLLWMRKLARVEL
ncbi:MAG: type II secretion system F family protein [Planctomycetes bacterium]|nr:type II secretion system F family protein [Planctomycetota bacterium]